MRNYKTILAVICLLLFSVANSAWAVEFSDVPQSHWAYAAIQSLSQREIVKGYPDNSFKPDMKVTREQFAIILVRALKIPTNERACQYFSDIGYEHRSFLYIDAAKGYIPSPNPVGYLNFNCDRMITREEVAETLVSVVNFNHRQKPAADYLASTFKDYQGISPEYRESVAIATRYGIMSGDSNDNFRGKANISRAELCVVLSRLDQQKPLIDEGLKTPGKPWSISFINSIRADWEWVRDFPDYNKTQTFFGKIAYIVNGVNNAYLVVESSSVHRDKDEEEETGEYSFVVDKTAWVYVPEKDLALFTQGKYASFSYDRNNNIISYVLQ